jgi:hypothetical protein
MRRALTLTLAAVIAVALAGCGPTPAPEASEPSARAVQKLLELRMSRSKDPKAYALFFKTDAIPKSLAEASARETTATRPPIPQWDTPYVSRLTSAGADVVIVWKADAAFPGHSLATVFGLEHYQDRWVVLDAKDVADKAGIPPPLKR